MLPSIKVSLPILFVLWCAVAFWKMNGLVMLAYPAMWLSVAALFYVTTKLLGSVDPADAA
ncbi:MAG: hypothetical protein AAFV43_09010 [Planctomycetota bacterium]